jgi:hypothetical protein
MPGHFHLFLCCYVKGCEADPVSFRVGKVVVASSAGGSKGTGVLEITLMLGCGGAVSRDAVCGLLTECLHVVDSAVPTMLCLFALLLNF